MGFSLNVEYFRSPVSCLVLVFGTATACGGQSAASAASVGSGGTTADGGSSGASATGSVSVDAGGTAGSEVIPPPSKACFGIRTNAPCSPEGLTCENLLCGIADTGRRVCNCATNWSCTACNHDDSPIRDRIPPFPECPADAADGVACLTEWDICGPVGTEHCVCYRPREQQPNDGLIWDCDAIPACWCP